MSAQPINPSVPPDHVTIEIDGKSLVVPKGSMIIQAADKAGISIPRFCYHEKLPIAANCRMCLVDVEKSPKPAPACATPVMDGMKVATRSEKALKFQRSVMEFLLINHRWIARSAIRAASANCRTCRWVTAVRSVASTSASAWWPTRTWGRWSPPR